MYELKIKKQMKSHVVGVGRNFGTILILGEAPQWYLVSSFTSMLHLLSLRSNLQLLHEATL